jgi:flagellar basal body P-ring formation protein FlgA
MKRNRIAIALIALAGALFAPEALAGTGDQVMLRDAIVVENRSIRLGDLFDGAGNNAEKVVAHAPAPGRRAVFDARWLYRVAKAYGLSWRPLTMQDQAVVERSSMVIGREDIEGYVLDALVATGLDSDLKVELSNRQFRIHLAAGSDASVTVDDIMYNRRTRNFSAVILAPTPDHRGQRFRVTGRVHQIREVPVLARRLSPNEIIDDGDIEWVSMRVDHLRRDTILFADEMIGKTPKSGLRAGRPIRNRDVQDPVLVSKRSLVTIYFKRPKLTLSAKGRALEDGSDGEAIRIVNTQSNTVIEAVVIGPNMVAAHDIDRMLVN